MIRFNLNIKTESRKLKRKKKNTDFIGAYIIHMTPVCPINEANICVCKNKSIIMMLPPAKKSLSP